MEDNGLRKNRSLLAGIVFIMVVFGLYMTIYSNFSARYYRSREKSAQKIAMYVHRDEQYRDAMQNVYGYDEISIADVR